MIGAGRLDRRVQFYRAMMLDNGLERIESYVPHGDVLPAHRADVTTRERMLAQQVQADLTTRFTIRSTVFSRGLTPKDKMNCEGQFFDITGIRQVGRQRYLELQAVARPDLDVSSIPLSVFSPDFSLEFA